MGVIGVIILVWGGIATRADDWGVAVSAALLSTIFYGIAGTYAKASPKPIEPFSNAHGSIWGGDSSVGADIAVLPDLDGADPWGLDCCGGTGSPVHGGGLPDLFPADPGHGADLGTVCHVFDPGVRYLVGSSFPR